MGSVENYPNIFKPQILSILMNKLLTILIGLILLIVPIYVWIMNYANFGTAALTFLQGGIIWLLLLIGAVSLLVGLSSLKD